MNEGWKYFWIINIILQDFGYGVSITKNCYGNLGCLETNSSWFSQHRPYNPSPSSRDTINATFQMYTIYTKKDGEAVYSDRETFNTKNFITKAKRNFFLIHGFLSWGKAEWLLDIKEELLKIFRDGCNVIVLDWSGHGFNYAQTAVNARLVALEMIKFIKDQLIKKYNIQSSTIHIIGHSLGAHIAGYVGEKIPGLYRITGLDPAGLHFAGMPYYVRLDPSDANFVDVIHTDTKGYGTTQPLGHVDFYANGEDNQPGCGPLSILPQFINQGVNPTLQESATCGHSRSHQYFIDTLKSYSSSSNDVCKIVAFKCKNLQDFNEFGDKCVSKCDPEENDSCMFVGLEAKRIKNQKNVMMYFKTSSFKPYCLTAYKIFVHVGDVSVPIMYTTVTLTFFDNKGVATIFGLNSGSLMSVQPNSIIIDTIFSQSILRSTDVTVVNLRWSSRFYPFVLIRKALLNGYIKVRKIEFLTLDKKIVTLCPRSGNEPAEVFEYEDVVFHTFTCQPKNKEIIPRKLSISN